MKRILGALLIITLFFVSITTAFCADVTYEVPELYLTVSMPEEYTVFMHDIEEDDPNLAQFGLTADYLNDLYEQNHIYLNAITAEAPEEVVVTMVTNKDIKEAFNLKRASEEDLNEFLSSIDEEFSKIGATLKDTSRYEHEQALFIVTDFTTASYVMSSTSRMYSTLINGQFINFTLHSYSDTFTDAQASILKQIVDSAVFVEQSSFDYNQVIIYGIIGAFLGGIIGLIKHLMNKGKRKKPDQNFIDPPVVQ
jgi:hypothetical protein